MGTFVITELQRSDRPGSYTDTSVRFEWTTQNRAIPENAWVLSERQRSSRNDPIGSAEPHEQVLGPMLEPFTLQGTWDDRYGGPGFAAEQMVQFRELIRRGNPCHFEFEDISVVGLISHLEIEYRRRWQRGYKFTVSPHQFPRTTWTPPRPQAGAPPQSFVEEIEGVVAQAKLVHANAPAPYMGGTIVSEVSALLDRWEAQVRVMAEVTASRVLTIGDEAVNSVSRLVQAFQGMQALAAEMIPLTKGVDAAAVVPYRAPLLEAEIDAWVRDLRVMARGIVVSAHRAARELEARVTPQALALYRPQADESLYAISNRFYGEPHRWRDIADHNGLWYSTMNGTEVLVIPGVS